jgi:Cu/Ag efflux pump CusA
VVIISGLMTAVAVTLFVLPFVYSFIVRTSPTTVVDSESEA